LIALILFGAAIYFFTLKVFRLDVTEFFKKTIQ